MKQWRGAEAEEDYTAYHRLLLPIGYAYICTQAGHDNGAFRRQGYTSENLLT